MALDIISSLILPKPPGLREFSTLEEANIVINEMISHMNQVAFYNQLLHTELDDLLEGATINSLSVDKLTAGTLTVDNVFIGSPQFTLDGVLVQLRIYDDQATPQLRVEAGRFGAGIAAGIKCYDSTGAVIFQVGSTNEFDGVFIKDLTVLEAAIGDLQVTNLKVGNNAVDENKRIAVYTDTTSVDFPSVPSMTIGHVNYTITHNLGRKVSVTYHVQNQTFMDTGTTVVTAKPADQTVNSIRMRISFINLSGGAVDPVAFIVETNYW